MAWLAQSVAQRSFLKHTRRPTSAAVLAPVAYATFGALSSEAVWQALCGTTKREDRNMQG
ncbi:hypothetical protein ALI22I_03880 [Saccharothrix sp. ALI-22-I]|uniref:hypothetical protein n=1 Tax=Saccharothrix sp. ALI-22-I TaxID=1933778 RepID=UPI00097C69F8|nr:hypothetical protein [Saccharothrix sp. ALI-22-I]ONI92408.1 hypothetical protein ALI22I_03880 [Saccharothrix sp. ALI-22-I]